MRISYAECEVSKGKKTSNNALKYYFKEPLSHWKRTQLNFLITRDSSQKVLEYKDGTWKQGKIGQLMVAYQTKEIVDGKNIIHEALKMHLFIAIEILLSIILTRLIV